MQLTRQSRWDGLIQKLHNIELLNINLLSPLDTHTYVYVSGVYRLLIFKSFALRNCWIIPIIISIIFNLISEN